MNLFTTIFGGMILTAVLYGVGRAGRLPNFWAAVVATGIPSFAYLVYAWSHWPGLDVVTINLVAYPTVALLLFQLYGAKGRHFSGVHWAPKLMISFFVILTVLLGGFVYTADNGLPPKLASLVLPGAQGKNVHTGFAGVVPHGEEAANAISQQLKLSSELGKLGWQVEVVGLDALRPGRMGTVTISMRDRRGQTMSDARIQLELRRPGQRPEQVLPLAWNGVDAYRAEARLRAGGVWLASMVLEARGEHIVLEHSIGG
jgi:nitrogen fixation protein FixH